ncbi:GlsB/YeaQ/YmgE family stress response membrane protein [Anianabacter salinae]|uniref:GlsB/YeaQ/YmgE family stress response membrane protein n=1 Tax=Anianabacter salinae TaxID=2851023 RepID=UPI00225E6FA7|nr:GlsB/YeaQ/YmgE family stress response membrane protein [Anianabacter salinae]MBV0913392.1 GlsB/YeaQ/YmgE family stress response membrane protein [Anianabacter salinae]
MLGLGLIGFLIIGLLAGWIAEKIMNRNHGLLMNLVVGVVGAYIGGWLFALVGLNTMGVIGSLIAAVVGAVVLLWIVGKVRKTA